MTTFNSLVVGDTVAVRDDYCHTYKTDTIAAIDGSYVWLASDGTGNSKFYKKNW